MNQTRRKDHWASSGRVIRSRRRVERTGETACVEEAMAGCWRKRGWQGNQGERSAPNTTKGVCWECACDQLLTHKRMFRADSDARTDSDRSEKQADWT